MKFLKSIKIEEIVLTCISLFFLICLFFSGFFSNGWEFIFKTGWANIAFAIKWWVGGMTIIFALLILRIYLFLTRIKPLSSFLDYFRPVKIQNALKQNLFLLRTPIFILTTTALEILIAGVLQQETENRLISLKLLNADKFITSKYLLLWLHSFSGGLNDFLSFLTPTIINSFLLMATIMGFLALILYFEKNKGLFKGYIMSLFIVFALAMPFWFFFPANSPSNFLLHDSGRSGRNFKADLSLALQNYQPNIEVIAFQEKIWKEQKNSLPVTTLPSMHWAWSIIIVYYLFKIWRKSIIFSSIWLILDLFGTIYLGNHYLVDGLIALPLTAISLFLANHLTKTERTYYQENAGETESIERIRKWFLEPFYEVKYRLFKIR